MCGIVGVIAKNRSLSDADVDNFRKLLLVDQLRGEDSTGVLYVFREKKNMCKIGVLKQAVPANVFINTEAFNNILAQKDLIALIGHNRFATVGSIDDTTAHPFTRGNVRLVHNGTLTAGWQAKLGVTDAVVDSDAIAAAIDREGFAAIEPSIWGAYSLVWHDVRDNTINMCRNTQRPMSFLDTTTSYMISSEAAILDLVVDRRNMKNNKIVDVPTYTHRKFKIYKGSVVIEDTNIFKAKQEDLYDGYGYSRSTWKSGQVWCSVARKYVWPEYVQTNKPKTQVASVIHLPATLPEKGSTIKAGDTVVLVMKSAHPYRYDTGISLDKERGRVCCTLFGHPSVEVDIYDCIMSKGAHTAGIVADKYFEKGRLVEARWSTPNLYTVNDSDNFVKPSATFLRGKVVEEVPEKKSVKSKGDAGFENPTPSEELDSLGEDCCVCGYEIKEHHITTGLKKIFGEMCHKDCYKEFMEAV